MTISVSEFFLLKNIILCTIIVTQRLNTTESNIHVCLDIEIVVLVELQTYQVMMIFYCLIITLTVIFVFLWIGVNILWVTTLVTTSVLYLKLFFIIINPYHAEFLKWNNPPDILETVHHHFWDIMMKIWSLSANCI